ncbi:hypothetical protein EUX98_g1293 [Antrodiella citrinella]|uniref:Gfd2/YDR514C-like C-terminal domain-containing protein n=1 Tax=Antrodiella citrinella TaxID=2447956 RepID=A0A4S4N4Q2_9APHY|nr:hypothetical protein EUX98_g1293 [Antrodiella citrinella]
MPTSTPTVLGYYRFTDIFYQWHVALPNPEDVSPLKALIAFNALTAPDHPLRMQGADGIELYIGTFDNGEARLLFSSAQVEYLSSDYLITQSSMQSCSPSVYSDAASLKKATRIIDKNNRRLKGTGTRLAARRLAFERIRALWSSKQGIWLAIDFENWDRDHTVYTEFGWSSLRFEDGKEIEESGHWIVDEYRTYMNTYVANNRERYNFGTSEVIKKKEFKPRIASFLNEAKVYGPVFLVFHDPSQDIKTLREIEAPITNLSHLLPDLPPSEGLFVIDTAEMFAALEGETSANKRGLEQVCRHLTHNPQFLHNAGNDAYWTLQACKTMASGDPVDIQREKRWPLHISGTQPKAVFPEPNSDDSDEDIM